MKWKWAVLLSALMLFLAACGADTVEEFNYTDHRGEQLSKEDLEGTPWLATFVFTNCETVCPPMTFNMADLQKRIEASGLSDYKIVAFSVDPKEDTPEKMREYLSHYPIPDESKWHLLTGYSQEEIAEFATENFKSLVKNDPNSDQVIHGTSFYLVDQQGEVIGNYDGFENVPAKEIIEDMQQLTQ
ncbi:SCO family protein [Planococcus plakortidis]